MLFFEYGRRIVYHEGVYTLIDRKNVRTRLEENAESETTQEGLRIQFAVAGIHLGTKQKWIVLPHFSHSFS